MYVGSPSNRFPNYNIKNRFVCRAKLGCSKKEYKYSKLSCHNLSFTSFLLCLSQITAMLYKTLRVVKTYSSPQLGTFSPLSFWHCISIYKASEVSCINPLLHWRCLPNFALIWGISPNVSLFRPIVLNITPMCISHFLTFFIIYRLSIFLSKNFLFGTTTLIR